MIVLLDMDGPLAGFDQHFFKVASHYGFELSYEGPTTQTNRFATDHVVQPHQRSAMRRMIEGSRWFRELPVTEGAQEGVEALLATGVEVWVVTKPLEANPFCRDDKAHWLSANFPDLSKRLILTPDKSLVHGDVLLDDAPHPDWLDRASWKPVIFTAGYNGDGSKWGHLPFWDWSDSIDELLGLAVR